MAACGTCSRHAGGRARAGLHGCDVAAFYHAGVSWWRDAGSVGSGRSRAASSRGCSAIGRASLAAVRPAPHPSCRASGGSSSSEVAAGNVPEIVERSACRSRATPPAVRARLRSGGRRGVAARPRAGVPRRCPTARRAQPGQRLAEHQWPQHPAAARLRRRAHPADRRPQPEIAASAARGVRRTRRGLRVRRRQRAATTARTTCRCASCARSTRPPP
jgi:hypothetical protein